MSGAWAPLDPAALAAVMEDFDGPWWICGGVAIDLFLGTSTRAHEDVDVSVLQAHRASLDAALTGWDVNEVSEHEVWARRHADGPWEVEFLFEQREGDEWVYRRDAQITMPLGHLGKVTADGVPYLVPEVVLLYKAKDPRPHDEADFEAALPQLGIGARCWLAAALEVVHPDHPWISKVL
ncbi:MAG: amino acid transporter [Actinobacteria bacterium]|nr:amino acid transporter [Actinomycetota bacterium]MBV9255060.1 amino acid transporter [Actinomycetota bacterium]